MILDRVKERAKMYDRLTKSMRRELAKISPARSKERLDEQVAALVEGLMKDLYPSNPRHY